jgi:hypothetical protein
VQPLPASITHSDEHCRMSWEIEVGQKEVETLQAKIKSLNDEFGRTERDRADVLNRASGDSAEPVQIAQLGDE